MLSHGISRRFPLLWGMLTCTYALAVGYRAIVSHVPPGLPSFAGFSAVGAVWLDYFAFVRDRILLRLCVLVSLLAAAGFNAAILAKGIADAHTLSPGRAIVTLLFLFLLYDKTRDVIAQRGHH